MKATVVVKTLSCLVAAATIGAAAKQLVNPQAVAAGVCCSQSSQCIGLGASYKCCRPASTAPCDNSGKGKGKGAISYCLPECS